MKTVLNQNHISARRYSSIATTFLMASAIVLPLAACDDTPATPPPQQPTEMTVQQDGRATRLVQGRENCIAGLIEYGRTPNEAGDICDRAFADAMARRAANEQTQTSSANANGGGGSNALLWYLIGRDAGRNSVGIYEGNSRSGLNFLGGYGHTSPPARSIPSSAISTPARASTTAASTPSSASKPATAPSSVARGGFAPGGGVGGHGG
jgi:hypothetical protein